VMDLLAKLFGSLSKKFCLHSDRRCMIRLDGTYNREAGGYEFLYACTTCGTLLRCSQYGVVLGKWTDGARGRRSGVR